MTLRLLLAVAGLILPILAPGMSRAQTPASAAGAPQGETPTESVGSNSFLGSIWHRDTLTGDWGGLRQQLIQRGITFSLQEQSEVWSNMTGGLQQKATYDGLTTGSVKVDLDKLAGWSGATFFVSAFQIHGHGPSGNLIGNMQLVSSIEATDDTKLYDLWLEQNLLDGRLSFRIGQEGANDELMISQYGALFLNSSFGFPALAAVDLPSGGPNYPLATPFVRASYQATDRVTLIGAVFNGDPAPPGTGNPQLRDKGGTAFRLNDHMLAFAELWYSAHLGEAASDLPGTYKFGVWYSSSNFADQFYDTNGISLASPASNGIPRSHSGDYAIYGIVDQMVWQKPGGQGAGIGVFLQVMGAPGGYNLSNLFIAGGMNWIGPFRGREKDTFGLAVSYLGISSAARRFANGTIFFSGAGFPYTNNETVVEATYLLQANNWLALQPDLQVVINPNAAIPSPLSRVPLKNDVVAGVRATVTF